MSLGTGTIEVTAAVCTAGERSTLRETLDSLAKQEALPLGGLEILVVDNSRDEIDFVRDATDWVAGGSRVPIRYCRETRPGLGFARNAAIDGARGEIVAFVDDDALADATWAWELARAYRETGAAAVGGRIDPLWGGERPGWLRDELLGYFSLLDWGRERRRCLYPNYPYGANISFRSDVLRELGGFATFLGVGGTPSYSMEETELCLRLERAGKPIWYAPEARVRHLVPASRLTQRYILERAAMHGRSTARMACAPSGNLPSAAGLVKGLLLAATRAAAHGGRAALARLSGREADSLSQNRHLVWNLAWMRESIAIALGDRGGDSSRPMAGRRQVA